MKPFSFEDVEKILKQELKKTKHILVYAIFGSCNVENDLDTLILKKADSKVEDFYKELHSLFERIDKVVKKKYDAKLICFNGNEAESLYLAKYKKRDLVFQILAYNTMGHLKRDWLPFMDNSNSLTHFLKSDMKYLIGSTQDIFSPNFKKKSKHDSTYLTIEVHDRLSSNYPEKLELSVMNDHLDYIIRKLSGKEYKKAKNRSELKKRFYEMCSHLND